ncbi:MAG TPA: LysR family transcriptional regulator [Mycobacteriales bacterium]|jgi:DNA-binding transcriptional LysR family regulator|nr:LysR family transcriptional regulator [Mycobacteriales bacterium]
MDLDKLRALVELSRLGTMTAVAGSTGYGTSAISQQLAALERQVGTRLLESEGRRVRLTPAGRRLAEHGRTILAAVTAAELDLAARDEPHGRLRIAGHTSALRFTVLPALPELARAYPEVRIDLHESEPDETELLLDDDRIDLGLVWDYTLVPKVWRHVPALLSSTPMVLAVPPGSAAPDRIRTPADLEPLRDVEWIGNSRSGGDEELARRLCAIAGWTPRIRHRADTLELLADLVAAGTGTCVLPAGSPEAARVRTVALDLVRTDVRVWAVVRAGTESWPATAAVIRHLAAAPPAVDPGPGPGVTPSA